MCLRYSDLKYFLLFFLCLFENVYSQSYYYFDISANTSINTQSNYKLFLSLGIDGGVNTRFIYKDQNSNQKDYLVEQYFDSTLSNNDTYMELVPSNPEPDFLRTEPSPNFLKFKITFMKKSDSSGVYFEPEKFDFEDSNQKWQSATIKERKQLSEEELRNNRDFLRYFFGDEDDFLVYINQLTSRGINQEKFKATIKQTTLHLIAVANTLDLSIGATTQKDLDKITNTFSLLASHLNIQYQQKVIADTDFSISNVNKTIKKLKVKEKDIIIFYYSGHGYRQDGDRSEFPRISFRINNNKIQLLDSVNVEIEQISEQLLKKNARVTIVLSDCCNENIDAQTPFGLRVLKPRSTGIIEENLNIDNCKKFFFPDAKLSLLIGAAEKGQLSVCNPELGGFFTNFFHAELLKSLYSNQGAKSWQQLFNTAKSRTYSQAKTALCTKNKRCEQTAILKFESF